MITGNFVPVVSSVCGAKLKIVLLLEILLVSNSIAVTGLSMPSSARKRLAYLAKNLYIPLHISVTISIIFLIFTMPK